MMLLVMTIGTGIVQAHDHVELSKFNPKSTEKDVFLTIDADALTAAKSNFKNNVEVMEVRDGIALIKTKESGVEFISHMMHEDFNRCGGFMFHDNADEARLELFNEDSRQLAAKAIFANYSIDQQDTVEQLIPQVQASEIEATIRKLSSFKNRYYQADTGVQSQEWIKQRWLELTAGRSDVKVEFFDHASWKQPSVVMTIEGAVSPDEVIIVGGHADSIAGFFGGANSRAPGADDNASGMSSITEVIRVLMQNSYRPNKTIQFMGYAAEEVGLRGSKEIAASYKNAGKNVIGVMQLDMTNFKGSDEFDIVMMTDFTNADQNEFIGKIIDEYLEGLSWGYDKCGYGCSDHASWHSNGFPASMPFEAKMKEMNKKIHTSSDTIDISRGTATHAAKFSQMAVAFVVELDR
tara:strand:- start:189 stop:1409 length:1221 start_codon:yes stop_codon:yes gene_type:complete